MTILDSIDLIGVALILTAYWGVQTDRLPAVDWRFSAVNGLGAPDHDLTLFHLQSR